MTIKRKNIILCVSLTLLLTAVIIILIAYNSRPLEKCVSLLPINQPSVILDAGHGGLDGGAVSENGTEEAEVNLSIAVKVRDIMNFLGIKTVMTRDNSESLDFDGSKSIRDNKNADLRARLNIAKQYSSCDFLSIHLNQFEEEKYFGAQVFYSPCNDMSSFLAESIQKSLIENLDSNNSRKAKESPESVYLMNHIDLAAVTIECGFLSNYDEERKLISPEYQTNIAIAITKGYIDYIKER